MMALTISMAGCKDNQPEVTPTPTPSPQPQPEPRVVGDFRAYVPLYHDWVWEDGNPEIQVYVVNPCNFDTTAHVLVTFYADDADKDIIVDTSSVALTMHGGDSTAVLIRPHKTLDPNIYRVIVRCDKKAVKVAANKSFDTDKSKFNIAVKPLEIPSPHDEKTDFNQFWANSKQQMRAVDPAYKIDTLTNNKNYFVVMVTAKSIINHNDTAGIVRFYYSAPKKEGRYPCYVEFPGYDQQSATFNTPISGSTTQCNMYVCPRGQYINRMSPYKKSKEYKDFVTDGLDSREHFYYRGAFMDAVRAMDYLFAQPQVDTANVFGFGSSQGGALTFATAALSEHKFAAISCCVPFLGDWPDYFRVGSWPVQTMQSTAKTKHGIEKEALLEMLNYFDIKNMAPLITCPVQEIYNLQDHTCPPHTNLSIYYNLVNVMDKEIHCNPTLDHTWPSLWNTQRADFFKAHKK